MWSVHTLPLLPCEVAHLGWSDTRETLASDVFAQRRQLSERDVRVCQLALFSNPLNQSVQVWTSHFVLSLYGCPLLYMPLVFGAETQRC